MAKRYKSGHKGLAALCVTMALVLAAACTLGGLQLWGKDEMKPSNWGKDTDLVPVTISITEKDALAPIAYASAAAEIMPASYGSYPSTKRATAYCSLPDGKPTYQWQVTDGLGLTIQTVNADGSEADITASAYFDAPARLTARAYLNGELRGIGSVSLSAVYVPDEPEGPLDPDIGPTENYSFSMTLYAMFTGLGSLAHGTTYAAIRDEFTEKMQNYGAEIVPVDVGSDDYINFYETTAQTDVTVILDTGGLLMDKAAETLEQIEGPFFVIDDDAYAAEEVEAAGGAYLIGEDYDLTYAQNGLENWAFDLGDLNIAYMDLAAPRYQRLVNFFMPAGYAVQTVQGYDYDGLAPALEVGANVICVPDMTMLDLAKQAVENYGTSADQFKWIIANFTAEDPETDAAEWFYANGIYEFIAYRLALRPGDIYDHLVWAVRDEDVRSGYAYNAFPIEV